MTSEEIHKLRRDTPGTETCIHLNNAGAALSPEPVLHAAVDHLALEQRVGGYEAAHDREAEIAAAYEAVANLLGCAGRNIAFTPSATHSFAQVLSAIPLEPGDVIVTTRDDYVSNQIMFLSLADRQGVRIERAANAPSGEVDLADLANLIDRRRPKLVAVTHVPTNSGLVQPVEAIGGLCADAATTYLVDACQSVGQIDLDVAALQCDFLSATSRKFLRGPRGFGFLYVGDRALERGYAPLLPDLRSATWVDDDTFAPGAGARRFEYWEQPYALLLATGEAARYALTVGLAAIEDRVTMLAEHAREALISAGFEVLDRGARKCGIVTVALPGLDPQAVHGRLRQRSINTSPSVREFARLDFDAKGVEWALRISPHYYNTVEELDTAVAELVEVADSSSAAR